MADLSQVYSSRKGSIDSTTGLADYGLKDVASSASQISGRELQVAAPKATTSTQWHRINRAIEHGQSDGVAVKITKVD